MQLAKVIGSVVASTKHEALRGIKLMMIQPLDEKKQDSGEPLVAVDVAQAGPGDLVYWVVSREASLALEDSFTPVDAAIVAIVDQVNLVKADCTTGVLDAKK